MDFFVKREKWFKSTFDEEKVSRVVPKILQILKWIFFFIHFFDFFFFIHFFQFSFKPSFPKNRDITGDYIYDFFLKLGLNESPCILLTKFFFIHFSFKTTFYKIGLISIQENAIFWEKVVSCNPFFFLQKTKKINYD